MSGLGYLLAAASYSTPTPPRGARAGRAEGRDGDGGLRDGVLVHPHRPQLHRHDPQDAGAGDDLEPDAALPVVDLRDLDRPDSLDQVYVSSIDGVGTSTVVQPAVVNGCRYRCWFPRTLCARVGVCGSAIFKGLLN